MKEAVSIRFWTQLLNLSQSCTALRDSNHFLTRMIATFHNKRIDLPDKRHP